MLDDIVEFVGKQVVVFAGAFAGRSLDCAWAVPYSETGCCIAA